MVSPLLIPGKNGERCYFDCYEAAFGGAIQNHLSNDIKLNQFYSMFDSFSLSRRGDTFEIIPRSININSFFMQTFNLTSVSVSSLKELDQNVSGNKSFVIDIDEFYFPDYNHFQKIHFTHASLGLRIENDSEIVIADPELVYTTQYGFCIKNMTIPINLLSENALQFYFINADKMINVKEKGFYHELEKYIFLENLAFWEGKKITIDDGSEFFTGIEAFSEFLRLISSMQNVKSFATVFYKWIFPLVWKRYYYEQIQQTEYSECLSEIIKEMEILETNLLRLSASQSNHLHLSALKRADHIFDLLNRYVEMENKRVIKKGNF